MKFNIFYTWSKKNAVSILLTGFVLLLFIRPNAKGWLLQKLVSVGLFKADIKKRAFKTNLQQLPFYIPMKPVK